MNLTEKDQEAIYHIASVSKHPHAAMIVKWLITGWKVEKRLITGLEVGIKSNKDNRWIPIVKPNVPAWSSKYDYRLVEPKPAKPAYRVYVEPDDGEPRTVTLRHYDKHHNCYDNKVEWISDWIEYDPPKQWPTPLIERIAAIDIKAAEWIVDNWDELLDEKYKPFLGNNRESVCLYTMFCWHNSPQGEEYWRYIANKLGE